MTHRAGAASGRGRTSELPVVDEARLWDRLQRLARVGAVSDEPGAGIVRPAYGRSHAEAAALVAGWMREAGLDVGLDASGSLVGLRPGSVPGAPAIGTGSHLDTVPNGGAFDGALGVLAAIEAAQTLADRNETLHHGLAVVGFADEEGNAFGIGVLSAQLWIDELVGDDLDAIEDPSGRKLRDAIDAFRVPGVPRIGRPELAGWLEAHVEQGPVLDTHARRAAAVEAIVGISRTTVAFVGSANHAGTTPMDERRDAAWGAAELTLAVRDLGRDAAGTAVATVGVLELEPGATNVIPGRARLRVELRSPDPDRLAAMRAKVAADARAIAARNGLQAELEPWHTAPPVPMDPTLRSVVRGALEDAGLPVHEMPSWAGHDAKVLARRMPVGMVFVPSIDGVSHAPGEATSPGDCAVAAEVLYHGLRRADRALAATRAREDDPR